MLLACLYVRYERNRDARASIWRLEAMLPNGCVIDMGCFVERNA